MDNIFLLLIYVIIMFGVFTLLAYVADVLEEKYPTNKGRKW